MLGIDIELWEARALRRRLLDEVEALEPKIGYRAALYHVCGRHRLHALDHAEQIKSLDDQYLREERSGVVSSARGGWNLDA